MSARSMVGLFAGIGGLELGLAGAGWSTQLLCEIDPGAQAVLTARCQTANVTGIRCAGSDGLIVTSPANAV